MESADNNVKPKRRSGVSRMKVFLIVVVTLILAMAGTLIFMFVRSQATDDASIIERAGKHIILPSETPNITTIEKSSELKSQPFFSGVEDGDKILIYAESARIIIYRPSQNILVNVGPIVDDTENNSTNTTNQ